MIFKDREGAGEELSVKLLQNKNLFKNRKNSIIISLLRGGVVVGRIIEKRLKIRHIPLAVAKISAPYNPELAIGAVCFEMIYLQKHIIRELHLQKEEINRQISLAQIKHKEYIQRYKLQNVQYEEELNNKIVIIVDDGAATGATIRMALEFVVSKKAKKTILALPVSPRDFDASGFNQVIIFHQEQYFSSVSRFYENFPQEGEL
ncbi:hypothetical protein HY041_03625 [Candidatus Roizmanbacteria bacterium]|nr:hypothetical protein [Candidatus Roizmanbacteria bacterium]